MKNLPKIMLALALLAFAPLAHAQESKQEPKQEREGYVRLGLGFAASVETLNTTGASADGLYRGFAMEVAFGAYSGDYFAIESMLSVFRVKIDGITVNGRTVAVDGSELFVTGMGNIYFIPKKADIQPFVGLGVGLAHQNISAESSTVSLNAKTTVFAWNASAGVNFFLTDNVAFGVGYRFFAGKKPSGKHTHKALVNLIYNF